MGLLSWMLRRSDSSPESEKVAAAQARAVALESMLRKVRARYDAAQTTPENRKHWAGADGLSANAANSAAVRQSLRQRARYEIGNNSYAHGIALTLANDTIGTGPRLQLLAASEEDNDRVEQLFEDWADEVDLAAKLRTMRLAKFQDGEAFALLVTQPHRRTPITLDLKLIEADRVSNPTGQTFNRPVDGIDLDSNGNPVSYDILRAHPGDTNIGAGASNFQADPWSAKLVLHYFTALRPEQARGIPELTSALPLFAQLRRYTLAVIAAAEVAADHAAVLQSKAPPSDQGAVAPEAMDTVELAPRLATVLPEGWELGQMRAEQPTTTYPQFVAQMIQETARCLNMPFNVAAGNSSGYNYASGRLDHQTYGKSIRVERAQIERQVLDRIVAAWISEAVLIDGFLPQSFRVIRKLLHQWFWDGNEHVDPEKEANATETRLRSRMTTEAEEYGRRGKDWRVERVQRLAERMAELDDQAALLNHARELGLPDSVVIQAPMSAPGGQDQQKASATDQQPQESGDAQAA